MTNECRAAEVSKTIDQVAEDGKKVELKPCPFCGGKARMVIFMYNDGFVECSVCKARAKKCENEEKFIEAWNRRVSNA